MFVVLKRKHIILLCVLLVVIIAGAVVMPLALRTEYVYIVPRSMYTVVVDAGHGGIDGGCVGRNTGVFESNLNLKYARSLASHLNQMGISVVMTRNSEDGLYDNTSSNLKRSEMKKREEIISSSGANLVVSIHMNSFPLRSAKGAQVFYKQGNSEGERLAICMQSRLNEDIPFAKKTAKVGDYYVLNCTELPSALVECGFLSNDEEERLLISQDYMDKITLSLACAIVHYLNLN